MRFLLVAALLLAGCSTPTRTQQASISDQHGKPLAHAEVMLFGATPRVCLAPTMGPAYTQTITDQRGRCTVTYPSKKDWLKKTVWILIVRTNKSYGLADFTEKNGRLLITVFPFGQPVGVMRLHAPPSE